MNINPDNTVFVVLSFEGPDVYSMAGGLSSRIMNLTNTLVEMGFTIHNFFIGDPEKKGVEIFKNGNLFLYRWCQWISKCYPGGVYDGEEDKLNDFTQSVPPYVVNEVILPAISQKKLVVILGEEWQTAETMCQISDLLFHTGFRDKAVMFWNANNTYGFERIDWQRLTYTTRITTVSKYMKQIMLKMGINPFVIANGIPKELLNEIDDKDVTTLKNLINSEITLSKVARWHPDKGWEPAINAIGMLKKTGIKPVLLARGGVGSYGLKVTQQPKMTGIMVKNVLLDVNENIENLYLEATLHKTFKPYFKAIAKAGKGDIFNFMFPIPCSFLQVIYKASDIVLANSIHEPFGLVGLEAMADGAIVFCGSSGEDYAVHMQNAIVLDTFEADEIQFYIDYLRLHEDNRKTISLAAKQTAEQWTWKKVVKRLICKLEYQAQLQGVNNLADMSTK
ncbi:MAG: glycosyltransferase family 4 protein [Dehalococcoidales bacterium]|nr:glycosyltransferase family 4 protein [Dehalococcoidales bacterium]